MDGMSFGNAPPKRIKEMTMFNMKSIFAAASLAVISAAGIGAASAQPWDHGYNRGWRAHERVEHRAYVNRLRIADSLRFHHYRVIGDPYFVHGRYVVRSHNRFGRPVFVQVDPYSGAFIGEVRL